MSVSCLSCEVVILADEPSLKCPGCSGEYHFGKCAGITQKSFKGKNNAAKKAWRCQTCRDSCSRNDSFESNESDLDIRLFLTAINEKLDNHLSLKEKVEKMEESLKFISGKFDEFQKTVCRQEAEIKEMKGRLTELEANDDRSQITHAQLQQDVHNLEYRSRQLNLEIHGIPVRQGESLLDVMNHVANKLEVPPLTQSDVQTIHRLPARPDNVPGIIARFEKQSVRDAWLQKRNKLKGSEPRIFLQENITRQNRELLRATKDVAKTKGYAFVWHVNGKILVRRGEGARAIHIKGIAELERL